MNAQKRCPKTSAGLGKIRFKSILPFTTSERKAFLASEGLMGMEIKYLTVAEMKKLYPGQEKNIDARK